MKEIHTKLFEGPIELLLYLVKKNDLNIQEIKISEITDEYLQYLERMKELSLDVTGDFLVIAATLIYLKAKSLLPREEVEEEEELEEDLNLKLLEYQKYKEISNFFEEKLEAEKGYFYRQKIKFNFEDYTLDVSLTDLVKAIQDVLKKVPEEIREFIYDEIPIEEKIRLILSIILKRKKISFQEIISMERTKRGIITCFLALLELIRLRQILVVQNKIFGTIMIYSCSDGER